MKHYYVYIMTNLRNTVLYTGVTSNLGKRVYEHKNKLIEGFTKRYNVTKLVYFVETNDIEMAIEKEKQIKGWLKKKKIDLINSVNPKWVDLSEDSLDSSRSLS
ncbi:GIY-YIG nuclease family protein [bacterium]|nr:GIY-YIG nuclease family protein [bacterium]